MKLVTDIEYRTSAELADHLRVSKRTVEHWRQIDFGPPYIRAGRACLYDVAETAEWERSRHMAKAPRTRRHLRSA